MRIQKWIRCFLILWLWLRANLLETPTPLALRHADPSVLQVSNPRPIARALHHERRGNLKRSVRMAHVQDIRRLGFCSKVNQKPDSWHPNQRCVMPESPTSQTIENKVQGLVSGALRPYKSYTDMTRSALVRSGVTKLRIWTLSDTSRKVRGFPWSVGLGFGHCISSTDIT